MHSNRHRKPNRASKIATRTAVSAGAAATALLMSAGSASAASPTLLPCTGGPIDSVTKGVTGQYCGGGPSVTR